MATGDQAGLIDSGATHPLRPQKNGEVTAGFPVVGVSLADGRRIQLKMSPGRAMISRDPMVEPIVPMGPPCRKFLGARLHGRMESSPYDIHYEVI